MGTGNCGARRLVNLRLSPPACRWISSPVVVSTCPACRSGGAPRAVNKRLINWPSASIILGKIRNDLSKDVRITVAEIISSTLRQNRPSFLEYIHPFAASFSGPLPTDAPASKLGNNETSKPRNVCASYLVYQSNEATLKPSTE